MLVAAMMVLSLVAILVLADGEVVFAVENAPATATPGDEITVMLTVNGTFEADVLNMAMFGKTARTWQEENPELKGNIRDYASINELICLSNMENINAVLINEGIPQHERLKKLNDIAIQQMKILNEVGNRKYLK